MKKVYNSIFPTFKYLQDPIELDKIKGPKYFLFVSLWNDKFLDDLSFADYLNEVGPSWPAELEMEDLSEVTIVDTWKWPQYFGVESPFNVTITPTLLKVENGQIVKREDYQPAVFQVLYGS